MNDSRFDQLTRRLARMSSRRRVISALPAAGVGLLLGGARQPAAAEPVAAVGNRYLPQVQAEFVSSDQGRGTVRVSWTFGDVVPNEVEVQQRFPAGPVVWKQAIDTFSKTPAFTDATNVAFPAVLHVCPLLIQNGSYLHRMEDEFGDEYRWDAFCIELPQISATPAPPDPAQDTTLAEIEPRNLFVTPGKGEFTVSWATEKQPHHFNVRVSPPLGPEQEEIDGGRTSFTQPRAQAGVEYTFQVQGCWENLFGQSQCSGWMKTTVTLEQGFEAWRPWFQIHPQTVFNQITPVAADARVFNNVALFKVGFDGSVWSTFWEQDAEGWRGWGTIFPDSKFAQEAPITAISRSEHHLDLFTTGLDGQIYTAWWDDGGGGWRPWFSVASNAVFRQDRAVAAVARHPDSFTLFRVGFDGAMWSNYWEPSLGGWHEWGPISPQGLFPLEGRVTAHSTSRNSLAVYAIGADGAVWWAWWDDGGGGWRPWAQIFPEVRFPLDQEIAVVSRAPGGTELFTVGHDGAVWTAWTDGAAWRPWTQIFPETRFAPNTRVSAISRKPGHVDLFITGMDGAVWSAFGIDDGVGWRPWFPIHPETVFDQQHPVTVLSRIPEHIDLFKVGFDGAVWSTFWAP